jgi:hypothetical protein
VADAVIEAHYGTPRDLVHSDHVPNTSFREVQSQGILTSLSPTPMASDSAFAPVEIPGPPLSRTILDDRHVPGVINVQRKGSSF